MNAENYFKHLRLSFYRLQIMCDSKSGEGRGGGGGGRRASSAYGLTSWLTFNKLCEPKQTSVTAVVSPTSHLGAGRPAVLPGQLNVASVLLEECDWLLRYARRERTTKRPSVPSTRCWSRDINSTGSLHWVWSKLQYNTPPLMWGIGVCVCLLLVQLYLWGHRVLWGHFCGSKI